MAEARSFPRPFRKQLPLPVRMGYGWLKRKFVAHPMWDNEDFKHYYQWLQETQWWSGDQLEEWQLEQLRALAQHAYENVPYYRCVFDEHRLKPDDITTLADLTKVPILTKEDVRDNLEDLIARNIDRERLLYVTTAGSTGRPLGLYQDKYTRQVRESAVILRQWGWAGYRPGDRIACLRGHLIGVDRRGNRRIWDYDTGENRLVLSAQDMSEENMYKYVKRMREFKPKFIFSYPSSLEILARFMKRSEVSDIGANAVFCVSENLYGSQREIIESQFDCKIFDRYGLTEQVADAVECERHEGYHVNMEFAILELIDRDGEPVTAAGALGRVVGTALGNYCMPLIRYATSDLATYASGECSCKRQLTLIQEFKGRIGEFIVSKTGQVIPFSAVYVDAGVTDTSTWGKIRELKFIQEREGELTVEMALAPSSSEAEMEQEFLEELYKWLDEKEFHVRITFVDRVSRTDRGKLSLLEQRLPIEFEDLHQ